MAARVHRRPHPVPVAGGGGVRGRQGRAVRAHHRPRAAGPADRGGHGPVRPRGRPRPTRLAAAEARHFDIAPGRRRRRRDRVRIDGELDLADALDLEAAIAADAHHQLLLGLDRVPGRPPRHRRRQPGPHTSRPSTSTPTPTPSRPADPAHASARWCCTSTSNTPPSLGAGGLARLQEASGPVTAEQVREWCAHPDAQITVQPVLDLAEHIHVGSYQASARLKLQTQLRDHTCAFPFCSRPAEHCDCEHRVPPPADPTETTPDRPAPATTRPAAGATTAPRPPAAGPTSPSNPAPTCGAARWATSSSATTPAPSTSPPTPNAADSPAPSPPTSANPDHPAPHPAQQPM